MQFQGGTTKTKQNHFNSEVKLRFFFTKAQQFWTENLSCFRNRTQTEPNFKQPFHTPLP